VDVVTVDLRPNGFTAEGSAGSATYDTTWRLETADDWITRSVAVTVESGPWRRSLELSRSASGRWSSETHESGDPASAGHPDLAPPGIATTDVDALDRALDCDLALCPLTNSMPILRLGLLDRVSGGETFAETELTMAWIDLPSLQILPNRQLYSVQSPPDKPTQRPAIVYQNAARDFRARLTVDPDGLVVDYEHMAHRVANGPR
jgi:hypothetical protein